MKSLLALAALALAAIQVSGAQEKLLALQVLEDELEADFESSVAGLRAKYRQALEKLKAEYLEAGDLDSTLAVKEEITRLDASVPGAADPRTRTPDPGAVAGDAGSFVLKPSRALVAAPVTHDSKHALLVEWKAEGFAEWPLANVARGNYNITLHFHSGPFAGGRLKLQAGGSMGELEIEGSGVWDEEKTLDLGSVSVTTGAEVLRLTVIENRLQGAMELREIVLSPAAKEPPPEPPPARPFDSVRPE